MIAVVRPSLAARLVARVTALVGVGWRVVVLPVVRFVLDVLACLALILQPAVWCAVAMAVAIAVGQVFVAQGRYAFAGFVVGSLSVCVVAGVLGWADHRHRWWSR